MAQAPGVTSPINNSFGSPAHTFGGQENSFGSNGAPALHSCAQFLLKQDEFTRLSNGSVFVSHYNLLLPPGHYRQASPASPGSLYICTPNSIASRGQVKHFFSHVFPSNHIIHTFFILSIQYKTFTLEQYRLMTG